VYSPMIDGLARDRSTSPGSAVSLTCCMHANCACWRCPSGARGPSISPP
jgi:hypothetical protein